jgi:CrcB protein
VIVLGLMVAGALGSVARVVVDAIVASRLGRSFPVGTLVINVSGSALLGVLTGLVLHRGWPDASATILGTGFCGGYTTFSTHAVDTVELARAGDHGAAVRNVAANVVLGTGAAALGLAAATAW